MPDTTPAYVRENGDLTYSVVDRETGAATATYATRREALDAVLRLPGFRAALPQPGKAGSRTHVPLRDPATRAEVGVWRWLDAAAEEVDPQADGSIVTAEGLRAMAAELNAAPDPKPIDGGNVEGLGPSGVHATLKDSGTLARGWAYVGCDWVDATGRTHLALFCEVFPEVDEAIDSGQLGFGSIGFMQSIANPDDAVLIQHSLTNRPATPGLVPGSAMRTHTQQPGRRFARGPMTRTHMPIDPKKTSARGPAADKLEALKTMLAIPPDAEDADLFCMVMDAFDALKDGATLEAILAGGGAPALGRSEGETDEAFAARRAKLFEGAKRAVGGLEGPALDDWASQVLALVQGLMGKPDATAAEALDFLNQNSDTISGALGAAQPAAQAEGAPQPPAKPAEPAKPAAPPAPAMPPGAARAEVIGFEARVRALETSVEAERKRSAELAAKLDERDTRDAIAKRFAGAGLVLTEAARDELVALVVGKPEAEREAILKLSLRAAASAPAAGTVGAGASGEREATRTGIPGKPKFLTEQDALRHHVAIVRAEKPGLNDTDTYREAYTRARADMAAVVAAG